MGGTRRVCGARLRAARSDCSHPAGGRLVGPLPTRYRAKRWRNPVPAAQGDLLLTRRQQQVLDVVRGYVARHGIAPTLEEIGASLGLASVASVHKHLRALEARGAIRRLAHRGRALEIVTRRGDGTSVPLLGVVAAGTPIEAIETVESVTLPDELLGRGETFVLRVRGDSMIDEGIRDGDLVVVERRADAADGATVVALVRGEATVKKLERRRDRVHLLPANERLAPIVARPDEVDIRGVVIGLLRRYR